MTSLELSPKKRRFNVQRLFRWILTLLIVAILGLAISMWLIPIHIDHQLMNELTDYYPMQALPKEKKQQARQVYERLFIRVLRDPASMRRLLAEMNSTPDDKKFLALAQILKGMEKFYGPDMDPRWRDRLSAMDMEKSTGEKQAFRTSKMEQSDQYRLQKVYDYITSNRDNPYIRRLWRAACNDPSPRVRAAAVILSHRLGEKAAWKNMLSNDPAPLVRATAILQAGLLRENTPAVRKHLITQLTSSLDKLSLMARPEKNARDDEIRNWNFQASAYRDVVCNAAFTLLRFNPKFTAEICVTYTKAREVLPDDKNLLSRLLIVLQMNPTPTAKKFVEILLADCKKAKQTPSAILLETAGKMNAVGLQPAVLDILTRAAQKDATLPIATVIAAIEAAKTHNIPCRKQAYDMAQTLWYPGQPILLQGLVHLLGNQIDPSITQPAEAPSVETVVDLLTQAAAYEQPKTKTTPEIKTPYPSAAAACAYWQARPSLKEIDLPTLDSSAPVTTTEIKRYSLLYLRSVLINQSDEIADAVAWTIGRCGLPEVFPLGKRLLPGPNVKPREYSSRVRETGAQILALSAQTPEQRKTAIHHMTYKMRKRPENERLTYQCALLMLGQNEHLSAVRKMLHLTKFSNRRAYTALLATGDRYTMDQLLYNAAIPPQQRLDWVLETDFVSVLRQTAPLPWPSTAALNDVQLWQLRIARHIYGLQRNTIPLGLKRKIQSQNK